MVDSHRIITARKFKARMDYIDLSVFGANIKNTDDTDVFAHQSKQLAQQIKEYTSIEGRLT